MEIHVTGKPNFSENFKKGLALAKGRRLTSQIDQALDNVFVTVYSMTRPVGRFVFEKISTKNEGTDVKEKPELHYWLRKSHIIERDYNPLEFAVAELVRYGKSRKIKSIVL